MIFRSETTHTDDGTVTDMETRERESISTRKTRELLQLAIVLDQRFGGFERCFATDGSYEDAGRAPGDVSAAATAWAWYDGATARGGALPPRSGNYIAELVAIAEALSECKRGENVLIIGDCTGALEAIDQAWRVGSFDGLRKVSGGATIETILLHRLRIARPSEDGGTGGQVVFLWAPAHSGGIAPNAVADSVAKSHLSAEPRNPELNVLSRLCTYATQLDDEQHWWLHDAPISQLVEARFATTRASADGAAQLIGDRRQHDAHVLHTLGTGGGCGSHHEPSRCGRAARLRSPHSLGLPCDRRRADAPPTACTICGLPDDELHCVLCECPAPSPTTNARGSAAHSPSTSPRSKQRCQTYQWRARETDGRHLFSAASRRAWALQTRATRAMRSGSRLRARTPCSAQATKSCISSLRRPRTST